MINVQLFPTQDETDGLFVIVLSRTGIAYHNQCGGNACDQNAAEGFLIPVGTPEHLSIMTEWFHHRFDMFCFCDGRIANDPLIVNELAAIISKIPCWANGEPEQLELDIDRLDRAGEAWVPVRSPFGIGWMTWTNSD